MLDLTSLVKALASLRRALARSTGAPDDEELRDAVIQRFEYTYELCWKMLKRRIEMDSATPAEIDRMSFRELLREGHERGLISDVAAWMRYRELRNLTTHLYDEVKAKRVWTSVTPFEAHATALLAAIERSAEP